MRIIHIPPLLVSVGAAALAQTVTQGKTCPGNGMCITSTVNGSTTTYELDYSGSSTAGWMGIGFGTAMLGSPMVIMWTNSDGSITLSQRQTSDHVMPTVVSSPPRVASLDEAQSSAVAASPKFVFTIPTDTSSTTRQNLVYAVGTVNPGSPDPAAQLEMHGPGMNGVTVLTLAAVSGGGGGGGGGGYGDNNNGGTDTQTPPADSGSFPPLTKAQKLIVGHAILFTVGFLFLLPLGALIGRYGRVTAPNRWFLGHWIVQFLLTGPILVVAFVLAISGVQEAHGKHFDSTHKKLGLVLCILYVVQALAGAFIHFVKDPNRVRRPPQNYVHAVLGLAIIAIAFIQVHTGYKHEWTVFSGRKVPMGANIVWIVWIVLLPLLYLGGLALLPRQFALEKKQLEARQFPEKRKEQSELMGAYRMTVPEARWGST